MKVFISHSSRDKWIAKRIATDLGKLSIETFLDEKDLEAGDDLDDIVDVHLQSCDELLILLSPTSVNSPWVLVEIGGAKALGKRIVPILLHLGANDIPSPITKKLALDLNNIEQYYAEAKARSAGKTRPRPRKSVRTKETFKVGDIVQFPTQRPKDYQTPDLYVSWDLSDNAFLGRRAKVIEVDDDGTFKVDLDGGQSWIAPTWVSKMGYGDTSTELSKKSKP
jgi:TIR domain